MRGLVRRSVLRLLSDETQGRVGRATGLKAGSEGNAHSRQGVLGVRGASGVFVVLHDLIIVIAFT